MGALNRGGVESWLLHLLRSIDRETVRMDFLVHATEPGAYDEEVRGLGSKVIPCPDPRRPSRYARNFLRALQEFGPYDAVHSHLHTYSAYVLLLADHAGVPVRIAHSHSDTTVRGVKPSTTRRCYRTLARAGIRQHATAGLAASQGAARDLFGEQWESDARWRVLHYGCPLDAFRTEVDSWAVRRGLGIGSDETVIGHVGRFTLAKNHRFWLEVASEILRRQPRTRFLLVGDGLLRANIEQHVCRLGLEERFIFAGERHDVPRLMLGAMDVLLFPSLWEGLPVSVIEAQAAGLPSVVSTAVPEEAVILSPLVRRIELSASPARWAEAVLEAVPTRGVMSPSDVLTRLEKSEFGIQASARRLTALYQQAAVARGQPSALAGAGARG